MKTGIKLHKTVLLCLVSLLGLSACNWLDDDDKSNNPPVALSETIVTQTDTLFSAQLPGTDADGDTLSFTISSPVSFGILTLSSDGSYTYLPNAEFTGTDSFSFSVTDGLSAPVTGVIGITVELLELSLSAFSREAFTQDPTEVPLSVNGRNFIQDVANQSEYQDLLDAN